jgi:hypothetical protein
MCLFLVLIEKFNFLYSFVFNKLFIMKKISILLLVATFFVVTSCATLFTGTKQTIQINSQPPGAKVQVDGIDKGKTPLAVDLKKGNTGQTITLKADGYETKSFQPETTFNGVSALNLLNLLFWGIDAATGALWKYDPKFYDITLDPVSTGGK